MLRPVDRFLAAYNLLLAILWLTVIPRLGIAVWPALAHLAAAGLPWAFRRVDLSGRGFLPVLREYYPLIWLPVFWIEMGKILPLLHDTAHDAVIASLDLRMFGAPWNIRWMADVPATWFSETMHCIYLSFIPLVVITPLIAGLSGRRAALRDFAWRLTLSYCSCCIAYLVFPVIGPARDIPQGAALTQGFFYQLMGSVQQLGDSLGTSFPSSHVAASATVALVAWRWFPPKIAAALSALALAIAFSTVYTQNHYAIDALAGICLAVTIHFVAAPSLERRLSSPP